MGYLIWSFLQIDNTNDGMSVVMTVTRSGNVLVVDIITYDIDTKETVTVVTKVYHSYKELVHKQTELIELANSLSFSICYDGMMEVQQDET